jgi:hypothetical protein
MEPLRLSVINAINDLTPQEITTLRFVAKGIWDEELAFVAFRFLKNMVATQCVEESPTWRDRFDCLYKKCYQFSRRYQHVNDDSRFKNLGTVVASPIYEHIFGTTTTIIEFHGKSLQILCLDVCDGRAFYDFDNLHHLTYDDQYMRILHGKNVIGVMRALEQPHAYFILTTDGMQFPFYHKFPESAHHPQIELRCLDYY